jgi:chromosome segregation ATPase
MPRQLLFILAWFVAGGLTFYALLLHSRNASLKGELDNLRPYQQRYAEQVAINASQREEFEARVQQLQSSLQGAQVQMSNLSQALQEAREMMEPAADRAVQANSNDQ